MLFPAPRVSVPLQGRAHVPDGVRRHLRETLVGRLDNIGEVLEREGVRFGEFSHGAVKSKSGGACHDPFSLTLDRDGIAIGADSVRSRMYAIAALAQIVADAREGDVAACRIEDWADFEVRGFMFDSARDRVPSIETVSMLIDLLALSRINHLQLYVEHTFAYRGHEEVWKDASPYTPEDIKKLVSYAEARGVEMVPNQNSYGHMERWLIHEKYRHLAECPDGFEDPWGIFREKPSTLCPILPESIELIRDLYAQYVPLFSSACVNVGGDEPWEHCKGRSLEEAQRHGAGKLYVDFMVKLQKLVASHGRKMMMWGDVVAHHPELASQLPKDIILMEWGYEGDHPFAERCEQYHEAGVPYFVCPGTSSWNTSAGRWDNAQKNLRNAARNGVKHGAVGYLITHWGDSGHLTQLPILLPGLIYGAALSWNVGQICGMESGAIDEAVGARLAHEILGSEVLAKVVLRLGSLAHIHDVDVPNGTIPHVFLTDVRFDYNRKYYHKYVEKKWDALIEELDTIEECLAALPVTIWSEELLLSCRMERYGAELGRLLKKQCTAEQYMDPNWNVTHLKKDDEMIAEAAAIRKIYRRLWMARSRAGGLNDSMAHIA